MATFDLGNVPSPIAQAMRLAQLRELQNPQLAMERQIQQAAQLQQIQQQSPEAQLALQLRQAQLNSAIQNQAAQQQQQAFLQQQQPLIIKELEARLQNLKNPEAEFQQRLQEDAVKSVLSGTNPNVIFEPQISPETAALRQTALEQGGIPTTAYPQADFSPIVPARAGFRAIGISPSAGQEATALKQRNLIELVNARADAKPEKSPFTQQTVVSLTDPSDVRQAIPDADGRPPAGYQFAKANDASKTAGTYTKQQLSSVNSLSDRFQKNDYVKKAIFAQNSIDIILQGLAQNNSTGDIAAINQFQAGMVDPGATVREGDVKLITNSAPLLARAQNYLPRLIKGSVLPPEMRSEMRKISIDIYNMRAKNANEIAVTRFTNNAKKAGIQFEDIGQEFSQLDQTGALISNAPAPAATTSVEDFLNKHDL